LRENAKAFFGSAGWLAHPLPAVALRVRSPDYRQHATPHAPEQHTVEVLERHGPVFGGLSAKRWKPDTLLNGIGPGGRWKLKSNALL